MQSTRLLLLLLLAPTANAAPPQPQPSRLAAVPRPNSLRPPLTLVGQLASGCTAFLVGPCHAATVAHCAYDPRRRVWWPGVEFFPGRCASGVSGAAFSPSSSGQLRR